MKINLHKWDRALRIILGMVLVSVAFFSPGDLWYFVGFIPLITGAVGFCPIYKLLNVSSHKA